VGFCPLLCRLRLIFLQSTTWPRGRLAHACLKRTVAQQERGGSRRTVGSVTLCLPLLITVQHWAH
jgi:hypothetical protein